MAFATPLHISARPTSFTTANVTRRPSLQNVQKGRRANLRTTKMLVVEAFGTEDMDKIIQSADESLVVVDYSTSWCGPCKIFAPTFEELSDKYEEVVFVKVMGDVSEKASELMKREGIRAVPAFHFWKSNERVKDITGARKEDVENAIVELK